MLEKNPMRFYFLLPFAFLAACSGTTRLGGSPEISVVSVSAMPQPSAIDGKNEDRPYLIGPFDKLTIDVFGVEGLQNREFQVDAGGRLTFPFAGVIDASGKTPGDLGQAIAARLQGSIRAPQVTVNLKEVVSQVVTVDGQVSKPGIYPLVGRMTLMRVVATAGGASEFAKLSEIVVFRTVNGQRYAGLYDLSAIRRGAYSDPEIFSNDVILVGDSPARRIFRDIVQAAPLITTPLIFLLNN